MIRVVLAVALATALLSASLPAVESARADRTAAGLDADVARLTAAATTLVDRDAPTRRDVAGARRVVAVAVPRPSWTTTAVDSVTVAGQPDGADESTTSATVSYTLQNGRQRRVRLDVPFRTPDGPVVLRSSGTHRLVLSLVRDGDESAVVVRRR